MARKKNVSLEEHFTHIEEIIKAMETGEITWDKSFALYKNGLEEIKAANAILDSMEQAILKLNENEELEEL